MSNTLLPIDTVIDSVFSELITPLQREIYCVGGNRHRGQQFQANCILREVIKAITFLSRRHFSRRQGRQNRLDNHRQRLAQILSQFLGNLRSPANLQELLFLFLETPQDRVPLDEPRRLSFLAERLQGTRLQNEQLIADRYFSGAHALPDAFTFEHVTPQFLRAILAVSILTVLPHNYRTTASRITRITNYIRAGLLGFIPPRQLSPRELMHHLSQILQQLQEIYTELGIPGEPLRHDFQDFRMALDGFHAQLHNIAAVAPGNDQALAEAFQNVRQSYESTEIQLLQYDYEPSDLEGLF